MAQASRIVAAVLIAVTTPMLGGCLSDEPERDQSGAIQSKVDNADIFAIKVGDCLGETVEEEIDTVKAIPCAEEHVSEVYAEKKLPAGSFPSRKDLDEMNEEFCSPAFEKFVGVSYDESKLDLTYIEPTKLSWLEGDRTVQCLVSDPKGPVKGSLKGVER